MDATDASIVAPSDDWWGAGAVRTEISRAGDRAATVDEVASEYRQDLGNIHQSARGGRNLIQGCGLRLTIFLIPYLVNATLLSPNRRVYILSVHLVPMQMMVLVLIPAKMVFEMIKMMHTMHPTI